MISFFGKFFRHFKVFSRGNKSMNLDKTAKTILNILRLRLRKISSSVKFEIFSTLTIRILFAVNVLNGMKHFIERISNDKKLIRRFSYTKSVIEGSVEKTILCIKP